MNPLDSVDAAFIDGVIAYLEGIPSWWTPHRAPSPEGIAWCNGWHDAQHTRLIRLRADRSALKGQRPGSWGRSR